MWNVLIADDEPKIRRGLATLIESFSVDFKICGEAEDGLSAMEYVAAELPDILLIDICMPRLNGLEFIEKIRVQSRNSIIIIITGHDEFEYARKAVELPIFEYVLKPVDHAKLSEVMQKAVCELSERRRKNKLLQWAESEFSHHKSILFQEFLKEWFAGSLSRQNFEERQRFLDIEVSGEITLLGVQVQDRFLGGTLEDFKENAISKLAAKKIVDESLQEFSPRFHFSDQQDTNYYIIQAELPLDYCGIIKERVKAELNLNSRCEDLRCRFDFTDFPKAYEMLHTQFENHTHTRPFIRKLSDFLENNYADKAINLERAAAHMAMSPGYVSRLLKQYTGYGFTEFTNRFRVCKAMNLIVHPEKKMYEISELVGYSSQHYFSRAFKRVTGISPEDYRREPEER